MSFTAEDIADFFRAIEERAEWRARLLDLIRGARTEAVETGPRRIDEALQKLAEAQLRTEERMGRVEEQIKLLAEAQRRTEERMGRVEEQIKLLAEAQQRTEERLNQLAEAQQRTEERLNQLAEAQQRTEEQIRLLAEDQRRTKDTVGGMKGTLLELRYRDRATAYFGRLLRRTRVVRPETLEEALEAHLAADDLHDALLVDLVVSGTPWDRPEAGEVWLAVEISSVVDPDDVLRASNRARLLRKAGKPVVPVVAGEHVCPEAADHAKAQHVVVLEDGRAAGWEQAFGAALGA